VLRRFDLPTAFGNAADEATRRITTMRNCMTDHRLRAHRFILTRYIGDLQRAADQLQSVIDELTAAAREEEIRLNEDERQSDRSEGTT